MKDLDYTLEYEQLIKETGIDIGKIPVAIRKKINAMKLHIGKYKQNPTDARKETIIKNDIATCDLIQDWIEKDYPDDIVDPLPTPDPEPLPTPDPSPQPSPNPTPEPAPQLNPKPNPEPAPQPNPKPTPEPAPQPNPEPSPQPNPKPSPEPAPKPNDKNAELEKAVRDNMQGDRIKSSKLKQIIGKTPEYPTQKVGSLILRKVTFADCYKLEG